MIIKEIKKLPLNDMNLQIRFATDTIANIDETRCNFVLQSVNVAGKCYRLAGLGLVLSNRIINRCIADAIDYRMDTINVVDNGVVVNNHNMITYNTNSNGRVTVSVEEHDGFEYNPELKLYFEETENGLCITIHDIINKSNNIIKLLFDEDGDITFITKEKM